MVKPSVALKRLGFALALAVGAAILAYAFIGSQLKGPGEYVIEKNGVAYAVHLPEAPLIDFDLAPEEGSETTSYTAFDGDQSFVISLAVYDPPLDDEELRVFTDRELARSTFADLAAAAEEDEDRNVDVNALVATSLAGLSGWTVDATSEDGWRTRSLLVANRTQVIGLFYTAPSDEFYPARWDGFVGSVERR